MGVQMRAAAEDFRMARVLGVNANTVIATAFAISGLLAGVAALLLVAQTGVVTPDDRLDAGARRVHRDGARRDRGACGERCSAASCSGSSPSRSRPTCRSSCATTATRSPSRAVIAMLLVRPQGLIVAKRDRDAGLSDVREPSPTRTSRLAAALAARSRSSSLVALVTLLRSQRRRECTRPDRRR